MVAARLLCALMLGVLLIAVHMRNASPSMPITLAVETTLTGPEAAQGREALRGVQLYVQSVNQAGGVGGRRLQVLVYDDRGDPATARQIAKQVAAGPALLLIGPYSAATAPAAGAIYAAARMPAIDAASLAARAMSDNPYVFSIRATLEQQGSTMGTYARQALGLTRASIVYTDDAEYGRPLAAALAHSFAQGGTLSHLLPLTPTHGPDWRALSTIAATLGRDAQPEAVFLAMPAGAARATIVALRRHGIGAPIICGDACAGETFADSFASYPEEQRDPGAFTDGIYAPAPVIYDSAPGEAQAVARAFEQHYGAQPQWQAATYYEAAQVAVAAMRAATLQLTAAGRGDDRLRIRARLAAMNAPDTGAVALDGTVYFEHQQRAQAPLRFGQFEGRRFISAPIQLVPVADSARLDLPAALHARTVVPLDGGYAWLQRVVYAGISINTISAVDTGKLTFSADCFFWLRYLGPDDVTDVSFPAATGPAFDRHAPIRTGIIDGLQYRLYHVTGTFVTTYDFHDYPFDWQQIALRFQNTRFTEDQVVYAIDALGLRLQTVPATPSSVATFQLPDPWRLRSVQYLDAPLASTSTLGDSRLYDQHVTTEYSGIEVLIAMQRMSLIFVIKHLLPLILLMLVQYVTLFFPMKLIKERVGVPVTLLVAGTVLLITINDALPEIGYPVAIEYAFYVFFALSLTCIVAALLVHDLDDTRPKTARRVDLAVRIAYAAVVVILVLAYLVRYGSRLV
jgi:ABC-type branched-subunit amino acid transport system substrate-binding protein